MQNKLAPFLIFIFLVTHFDFCLQAAYSPNDSKNKDKIENEIKEVRKKIANVQKNMKSYEDSEWKAYMKDAKGVGKNRADKFNNARDLYEAATTRKQADRKFIELRTKYDSMKKKLDQLEWELEDIKKKEKARL